MSKTVPAIHAEGTDRTQNPLLEASSVSIRKIAVNARLAPNIGQNRKSGGYASTSEKVIYPVFWGGASASKNQRHNRYAN